MFTKIIGSGNFAPGTLEHLLEAFEDAIESIHAYACKDDYCVEEHIEAQYALTHFKLNQK